MQLSKQGNRKQGRRPKTQKRRVDQIRDRSDLLYQLPRSVDVILPDRVFTRLRFWGTSQLTVTTGGAVQTSSRFRPSSAFDVDPLLGSTTMSGFAELAAIYGSYRVRSSEITLHFTNQSAVGLACTVLPLNADPGAAPAQAVVLSWPENPYAKTKIVGTSGSPSIVLKSKMTTGKIFGTDSVYLDDNFAALVTASPANNWFWAIGVITNLSPAANSTVFVEVNITIDCEFFNRKFLQT